MFTRQDTKVNHEAKRDKQHVGLCPIKTETYQKNLQSMCKIISMQNVTDMKERKGNGEM